MKSGLSFLVGLLFFTMMPQIDVHGMTREQAESYLRVNLLKLKEIGYDEILVIHGKGTGILRQSVRLLLRQIPYVKHIKKPKQNQGGDGATLVIIK